MARKLPFLTIVFFILSLIQSVNAESGVEVDSLVREKLQEQGEFRVIIRFKDQGSVTYDEKTPKRNQREIFEERMNYFRQKEHEFLSTIAEAEFSPIHLFASKNAIYGSITKEGLDRLEKNVLIETIEGDRLVPIARAESVKVIEADYVQRLQDDSGTNITGEGIAIAIIDSGIDYNHPDLGGCSPSEFLAGTCDKVVAGHNYINDANDPNDPMDDLGHGTHVAGIAAGDGSTCGVAPGATLIALKACYSGGCPTGAIASSVDWCMDNAETYNIKAINMSLGGPFRFCEECDPSNVPYREVTEAINDAYDQGIFVAVASGNKGYTNGIHWPSCVRGATSVGATYDADFGFLIWVEGPVDICTDEDADADEIVCITNRCDFLDLLAPGAKINSTKLGGGYEIISGTSMAAPHVAGVAALLLQVDSSLTPDDIEDILKSTGISVYDAETELTFKRIDAYEAVGYISRTPAFSIKNSSGDTVACFTNFGDLFLKGTLEQGAGDPPVGTYGDGFRVKDSDGSDVAIIDATDGNMYIKQNIFSPRAEWPSGDYFTVANKHGEVVARITPEGKMYLKGKLYQNANP